MYGAVVVWFSLGLLNGVTSGELNVTWKGTYVYIRSLTADNRVEGRVRRAQTQVYVKARLWRRLQKYTIVFMVSSEIPTWMCLEELGLFLELAALPKWAIKKEGLGEASPVPELMCGDCRNFQRGSCNCSTPLMWAFRQSGQTGASPQ